MVWTEAAFLHRLRWWYFLNARTATPAISCIRTRWKMTPPTNCLDSLKQYNAELTEVSIEVQQLDAGLLQVRQMQADGADLMPALLAPQVALVSAMAVSLSNPAGPGAG